MKYKRRTRPIIEFNHRYLSDVRRIKEILNKVGYPVSLEESAKYWQQFSNLMCSGWMYLHEDDNSLLDDLRMHSELEEDYEEDYE